MKYRGKFNGCLKLFCQVRGVLHIKNKEHLREIFQNTFNPITLNILTAFMLGYRTLSILKNKNQ